jgi:uncharacterized Ntn-hydrolase superfamily protein
MKHAILAALAFASTLGTSPARATYSLVAVDREARQIGGAGVSCVGAVDVFVIYGSVTGVGAVHAQAALSIAGRNRAVALLEEGLAPAEVLASVTDTTFDAGSASRQYGVVDLEGRAAGFTGAECGDHASDAQGELEPYVYSVQGNILTSAAVIQNAEAGFRAEGCDLAARLMRSIEAGATNGEGDSRCTGDGLPADSGFIHVELEDGSEYLHLSVEDTSPESPLAQLRTQFDAWRLEHPCPEPTIPGAGGGGGEGGAGGAAAGGGEGGGTTTGADEAACSCSTPGGNGGASPHAVWFGLAAAAWLRRRRARRTKRARRARSHR